ncbi:MAG: NAD(P)H-dependent oxidoreductase [Chloroflexi bacterium]|nr:NAD(P)H-dependent oxidoreductase [Chloroflexota bacterium]
MAIQPIHIVGIAGSLRQGSYNRGLIKAAQELAPPHLTIEILDLKGIPFYDGDVEEQGDPAEVQALKETISKADALLIATPEYNAGMPASLKNATDWASRSPEGYRKSAMYGKTVAIMGGGGRGAVLAQEQLVQVLGVLGVDIIHPQVAVSKVWDKFDATGGLVDEATREQIKDLLGALSSSLSGTWINCMQWRQDAA